MPRPDQSRERPRVCLVLHKFSRGGSDRVAAYLANGFRDAGMDVELTVLCRGGEVENYLVDFIGDIPIRYLGKSSRSRGWDLLRTFPALVRHLRNAAPDAVISTANNTLTVTGTVVAIKSATEFQIQGLELDWICVTWDADLRMEGNEWRHHAFRGDTDLLQRTKRRSAVVHRL